MSFAHRNNFPSSFSISMSFISFSCPVALSRTSSTVLNRNRENEHPYLLFDPREKAFSLSLTSMILAEGVL